jgi:sterol desaturase/sphingolipid hydroxylase (fatty acid hydroxylase superfamily)
VVLGFNFLSFRFLEAPFYLQALTYAGGFLFWTFFEYLMHRYIFHLVSESKFLQRMQYASHGVHHEFPRDVERVFMPPLPGIITISILFLLCYFLLHLFAFPFLAGMISGYMLYSLMHYSMHHLKPPRWLKPLWKHHSLHHYKYPNLAFGVSTPIWDYVFGTMPPNK